MIFDTHTHAYFDPLKDRETDIIGNMHSNGVYFAVQIGCDAKTSLEALRLATRHPWTYRCSAGLHPVESQNLDDSAMDAEISALRNSIIQNPDSIVAIGETGWDFYHLSNDPAQASLQKIRQKRAFEAQIALAKEFQLPLVIHTRDSSDAVIETFTQFQIERAVIHCYSENLDFAKKMMQLCPDIMFGFSGILTYKSAKNVQETAAGIPLDRILVETDAPFLSPVPLRWAINESANVRHVLEKLKTLRTEKGEVIEKTVWENSIRFYKIPESSISFQ